MVSAWALGLLVAGLALITVELAYPRRYLGPLGLVIAVAGFAFAMTEDKAPLVMGGTVLASAALTAAITIPFYRRFAPHVGPAVIPNVGAGSLGTVAEAIVPPKEGLVRAGGILWTARAEGELAAGTTVRILVVESDRLWVEPELDEPSADQGDGGDDDQRGADR